MATARTSDPVAILGGGLAGLIAARVLDASGHSVVVLEGSNRVGGLASSENRASGLVHDVGAHFISNRLARNLGAAHLCRRTRVYEESVFLAGRWYRFPFGLLRLPCALREFAVATITHKLGRPVAKSAGVAVLQTYGDTIAKRVILPQLRSWAGVSAYQLAPATVDALPASFVAITVMHALRLAFRVPIALGYSKERTINPFVWHVYPKTGGIKAIAEHLAKPLLDKIRFNDAVKTVNLTDGMVTSVTTASGTMQVRGVISTLPANVVPFLLPTISQVQPLRQLKYRKLIIVNLLLSGGAVLPDVVGWFPEPEYSFFRITEVPQAVPWLTPSGTTAITVDFSVDDGHEAWSKSAADVTTFCLEALRALIPDVATRCVDASVTKVPLGYPLFLNDYEELRQQLPALLRIPGFRALGRNAEFAHLLMEDVYWRAMEALGDIDRDFR